jgi:hypothetical protein
MRKATHTAKVKAFLVSREQYMSSYNSYTIILPFQTYFFKHRSLEDVLSSPDAPLQQALITLLVVQYCVYTRTGNNENLRLQMLILKKVLAHGATLC